jgi:hypothetical protein
MNKNTFSSKTVDGYFLPYLAITIFTALKNINAIKI